MVAPVNGRVDQPRCALSADLRRSTHRAVGPRVEAAYALAWAIGPIMLGGRSAPGCRKVSSSFLNTCKPASDGLADRLRMPKPRTQVWTKRAADGRRSQCALE